MAHPVQAAPKRHSTPRQVVKDIVMCTGMACAVIVFSPCLAVRALNQKYQFQPKYHVRQYRRQRNEELTPPKVEKGGRSVTPRLRARAKKALRIEGGESMIKGQEQSLLFALPPELRDMIYERVVGRERIYVGLTELDQRDEEEQEEERDQGGCIPWRHSKNAKEKDGKRRLLCAWRDGWVKLGVIPFLQSCRRIYLETIDILYTHPTFTFRKSSAFLSFSSSLPPHHFSLLRHIHFDLIFRFKPAPDSLLNYKLITSRATPRMLLPIYTWKNDTNFLRTCCVVMEQMEGLKEVSILMEERTFENKEGAVEEVTGATMGLVERGVDVRVRVEGDLLKLLRARVWLLIYTRGLGAR
ncbi:hypothetical protein P154DRAFT_568375 [Amniculicola lignicola CBS 123094]|uniref:DUF7730 domain-containing protein n=1 Tax=Amniculicola lignicola CBS 123094 TaxID=1392246 RepID=A0A6A5W5C3_9PLEO|nr:hypothetical protein P154DRAFT_568375 [Amniculicola lignicola CBS 123094]